MSKQVEDNQVKPMLLNETDYFSKEDALTELNREFQGQPDRSIFYDSDILSNFQYQNSESNGIESVSSIIQQFANVSKNKIKYFNLTQNFKDYSFTMDDCTDTYFMNLYSQMVDHMNVDSKNPNGTKNISSSQVIYFEDSNQKFIVLYQLEHKKQNNTNFKILSCIIYQFQSFEQGFVKINEFLIDINTKSADPLLLNRVFIDQQNIYYYKKYADPKTQEKQLNLMKSSLKSKKNLYSFLGQDIVKQSSQQYFKNLENYVVKLPQFINLEDCDIGFIMQPVSSQIIQLQNQFMLVQSQSYVKKNERILLIYSLKNLNKPIFEFYNGQFKKISYAFAIISENGNIYFILKSTDADTHYQLEQKIVQNLQVHVENSYVSDEDEDEILKEIENYGKYIGRFTELQIDILDIEVPLSENDKIIQYYYISVYGKVELIFPIQSKEKDSKKKSQYENVIEFIEKYHQISNNSRMFTLYFRQKINYLNIKSSNDEILEFLKSQGSQHLNEKCQILFYDDVIIIMNGHQVLDVIAFNQFEDIQWHVKDFISQNNQKSKIQNLILNEFDINSKQIQNNTNYLLSDNRYTTNQFLNPLYMNKLKKSVISSHNFCLVNGKKYEFENNYLLIDLSCQQSYKNKYFHLIKLYEDNQNEFKLIKYQISSNYVILFFIHRKYWKEYFSLKGVYFFTIVKLKELTENLCKPILSKDRQIFIPVDINHIHRENFSIETLLKYHGQNKYINGTQNELSFEMVKDFLEPCSSFLPFVFHSNLEKYKFEHYFCWIDIEKFGKQSLKETMSKFSDLIYAFKLEYYQRSNEPFDFNDCDEKNSGMRHDVQSQLGRSQSMLTRCSNWEYNPQNKSIQARYQIAFDLKFDQVRMIEVKELVVIISENNTSKINKIADQNAVQSSLSIQILPLQMIYLTFSQSYIDQIKSSQKNKFPIENNRLIPQIDDDGGISGSFVMINHKQSNQGIYKITDDLSIIEKNLSRDMFQKLKDKKGQNVMISNRTFDSFDAYFQDGSFFSGISVCILDIIVQKIQSESHLNLKNVKIDFEHTFNQIYVYDIIDLTKIQKDQDSINQVSTPMVKIKVMSSEFVTISQVALSKQCIDQKYLNKKQAFYWLYYFMKNVLSSSLINFKELFHHDLDNYNHKFCQPRFILKGKNLFNFYIKKISFSQIQQLYFNKKEPSCLQLALNDSVLQFAAKNNKNKDWIGIIKRIQFSFDINEKLNYQCDFLNQKSIIQCLFENKKIKEVSYLVDQMIRYNYENHYGQILIQDFPWLTQFKKFDLNDFLDVSVTEELMYQQMQNSEQQYICNLENIIEDDKLEMFGSDKLMVCLINQFEGLCLTFSDVVHQLLNFKDSNEKHLKDQQIKKVQVSYSSIDFIPMMNKIQIDLIQNYQYAEDSLEYEYLKDFTLQSDISCSYLFISKLININNDTPNFFEQSSVQKMIDVLYVSTRPMIKLMLIFYFICFYSLFIYNCVALEYVDPISSETYAHLVVRWCFYVIGGITQIVFVALEYAEMKANGIYEYFSDSYNVFDFSMPIFYIVHIAIRINTNKIEVFGIYKLVDNIIMIILIMGGTSKILQYIRFREEYSFFVQMLFSTIKELIPFFLSFLLFLIIFGLFYFIMQCDTDGQDDNYPGMTKLLRLFCQVYRVSVGDVHPPDYSRWNSYEDQPFSYTQNFSFLIIWIIWFSNIFILLVIMINLLIAQVSQIYDKIMAQSQSQIYKERAELNKQVFQIFWMLGYKYEFKTILIQKPLESSDKLRIADYSSFSTRIIQNTEFQVNNLMRILKVDNFKNQQQTKQQMNDLNTQIKKVNYKMEEMQKKQESFMKNQSEQMKKIQEILNPGLKKQGTKFTKNERFSSKVSSSKSNKNSYMNIQKSLGFNKSIFDNFVEDI